MMFVGRLWSISLVSAQAAILITACLFLQTPLTHPTPSDSLCTALRTDRSDRSNQPKTFLETPAETAGEDDSVDDRQIGSFVRGRDVVLDDAGSYGPEQPLWLGSSLLHSGLLVATPGARAPPFAVT